MEFGEIGDGNLITHTKGDSSGRISVHFPLLICVNPVHLRLIYRVIPQPGHGKPVTRRKGQGSGFKPMAVSVK